MLNPQLVEKVIEKLGLEKPPEIDLAGLSAVYGRWCRKIPFDNIQKRLFYGGAAEGPVPGHNSEDFFRSWLAYGAGGTCWANSHAMHDLLEALGFDVVRGAGTMLNSPDSVGPTHGTVIATLDGGQYLVDGSMLTERPVLLEEGAYREVKHPAERVRLERHDGRWHVLWHPAHRPDGLPCRIEQIDVPLDRFNEYHERTRVSSRFNAALYVRANQPESVLTISAGEKITTDPDGQTIREPLPDHRRAQALVEEFGIAEELVARLPADEPPASP